MEEKIKKWEAEIETIAKKQKEMNEKYNERMRELRKKIEEAELIAARENNRMIAEVVRECYGEVSRETLEMFRQKLQALKEEEKQTVPEGMHGVRV